MDRRRVLAGLAGLAATPALAQTNQTPATTRPGASGGAASGAAMAPAAGPISPADLQHMQQTLQLGAVALETSRIAQQKAANADLKQFAGFEVQEQMTLSEILRSMMEPAATATTGAGQSGSGAAPAAAAPGPMPMDAQGRDMLQKLQSAQAGAAFDRQYLQGQIQGHRDLLQVQEHYLQANPQNREHVNVTKLARGQIREHIALLETIQQKMR
jgi:predicted outer membrane protein